MLLFINSAEGELFIDDKHLETTAPLFISIRPNSILSLSLPPSISGVVHLFKEAFFALRYNNNVLNHFSFLKHSHATVLKLQEAQWQKLAGFIQLIKQEFSTNAEMKDLVLRSYLNILLAEVERFFSKLNIPEKFSLYEDKYRQFEALLESNFLQYKTPGQYAAKMFITTNYLNKICNNARGLSSGEIIRKRIALESQRLLHHTNLTVAEVAHRSGFESTSYFVTFFKRQVGQTPDNFRKNCHDFVNKKNG